MVQGKERVTPALKECKEAMRKSFGIYHTTIQIEIEGEFDHAGENYGGIHGKAGENACCQGLAGGAGGGGRDREGNKQLAGGKQAEGEKECCGGG